MTAVETAEMPTRIEGVLGTVILVEHEVLQKVGGTVLTIQENIAVLLIRRLAHVNNPVSIRDFPAL